jgi:DNA-binding HxlR family transcriptional regulator
LEKWCSVTATSKLIAKKWYPVIVDRLMQGERRFGEIKESIPGISAKVLSDSLETLEKLGLVERIVTPQHPVSIRYSLTKEGADLAGVVQKMREWGDKWLRPTGMAKASHTRNASYKS